MKVGSLFSGIGGIEIGFEKQGFETEWFVENNEYAATVLRKRFPRATVYGDITQIDFRTVPQVDVLTGGFPCQDISNAGKRVGIEGSRSSLWKHYLRAISEVRPKYALIENVSALTRRGLDVVLCDLASIGYDAEWHCVSASSIGALHRRDRIFIVAYSESNGQHRRVCGNRENGEWLQEHKEEEQPVLRSEAAGCSKIRGENKDVANTDSADVQAHRKNGANEEIYGQHSSRSGEGKSASLDKGRWSVEPSVGRVASRLSAGLDKSGGGLNAHESCITKASTAGLPVTGEMPTLRTEMQGSEASSEHTRCALCRVPLSEVPHSRRQKTWELGTWEQEVEGVRSMRQGVHELYAYESKNLQQGVSVGAWAHQCFQTVAKRVDRIKCLGNAVVPQCAEVFAKAIKTIKEGGEQ